MGTTQHTPGRRGVTQFDIDVSELMHAQGARACILLVRVKRFVPQHCVHNFSEPSARAQSNQLLECCGSLGLARGIWRLSLFEELLECVLDG